MGGCGLSQPYIQGRGNRLCNGKWPTQVPHLEQGCKLGLHSATTATLDFSLHHLRPDQASSDR